MEFVKLDKWYFRFILCLLICMEFYLLLVVKSFENFVIGGNIEILGWCVEFECVLIMVLYLGSVIFINDEFYWGFWKGNFVM